jgi:hypothetical protein
MDDKPKTLEDLKAQATSTTGNSGCPKCGCRHMVKGKAGKVCRNCGVRPIGLAVCGPVVTRRPGLRAVILSGVAALRRRF